MAARMPAVLLDDQCTIVLGHRPTPVPRADEVPVEVDVCGICGGDLRSPDLPQVYSVGFTLGHERSRRVLAAGADPAAGGSEIESR